MRSVIVSGGDANYFPLLEELTLSIRRLDEGKTHPIAMLDGGLTDAQKNWFAEQNVQVVDPGWPSDDARKKAGGKEYLKINLAKVALDKLLPEYDIIIFLDGDTWLQTWDAIPLMERVAAKNVLAITSQDSRYNQRSISFRKRLFGWVELRNILHKNAKRAGLSRREIWTLAARPTLNAGAYALHRDAPHWAVMRAHRDRLMTKGRARAFTSDQLAMGLAVFCDGLPWEALPEICNYRENMRFDAERNMIVEYGAPYTPVSVVHLCGRDANRQDDTITEPMPDMTDEIVMQPLRFRARFPEIF